MVEIQYERLLERQRLLKKSIEDDKVVTKNLKRDVRKLKIAFDIFSGILTSMRKLVIKKLRKIVTPVVQHVFEDRDFSFDIQYKQSGTNHYYTPVIKDGNEIYIPKYETGGGLIPILDFSLRVTFLELDQKDSEKIIFLDEPFGWLGDLSYKAVEIILVLSKRMNIQFIINTHDKLLEDLADRKWEVVYQGGKSCVERIKDN